MNGKKAQELRDLLEATPLADPQSAAYVLGRILLQIAVELDRIAETQEEAHK